MDTIDLVDLFDKIFKTLETSKTRLGKTLSGAINLVGYCGRKGLTVNAVLRSL